MYGPHPFRRHFQIRPYVFDSTVANLELFAGHESRVWDKFNSVRTHCIKGSSRQKVGLLLALSRPTQH